MKILRKTILRSVLRQSLAALAVVASVCTAGPTVAAPVQAGVPTVGAPSVEWIRVNPNQPQTLYLGLHVPQQKCGETPLRSTDGGKTWGYLGGVFNDILPTNGWCEDGQPFVFANDGSRVYAIAPNGSTGLDPSYDLLGSAEGLHWKDEGPINAIAASPTSASRLYASTTWFTSPDSGNGCKISVKSSDGGGLPWQGNSDPNKQLQNPFDYDVTSLVADLVQPDTVYANLETCSMGNDGEDKGTAVAISTDKGTTWTRMRTPTGLSHFTVGYDVHEPKLLVGKPGAGSAPADHLWLSSDGGGTWRPASCPGDLGGACPTFVVDNVFGFGMAYGFYKDGIHAFQNGGGAGARLPISDRLPFPYAQLTGVAAGRQAGDPIYLAEKGTPNSALYRSTDSGQTWQRLALWALPNAVPPGTAPGMLLVPQTGHSVAAPFVATYRRLGLLVLGYPVTEAFLSGDRMTQDFQHLELQLQGNAVVVAALGREVFYDHLASDNNALVSYWGLPGEGDVDPAPNTATRLYFPQTYHTLQGDLLRFWQQHGALAVFGAPLTEIVKGQNGDGSGRTYEMQYFEQARLERHPENADPRYRILLGLIGNEALVTRGWAVTP